MTNVFDLLEKLGANWIGIDCYEKSISIRVGGENIKERQQYVQTVKFTREEIDKFVGDVNRMIEEKFVIFKQAIGAEQAEP